MHTHPERSASGFTLVEVSISLTVLVVLLAVIFEVSLKTTRFFADGDLESSVQAEALGALRRLSDEVKKSGWSDLNGVSYPLVAGSGTELRFRVLQDLDGNGAFFDDMSGEVEWSSKVFSVRLDPKTSELWIYDGQAPVLSLGRHIQSVRFATINEDATLDLNQIRAVIVASKRDREGRAITFAASGSIRLRNSTFQ